MSSIPFPHDSNSSKNIFLMVASTRVIWYRRYQIILHLELYILAMNIQIINDCAGTDPGRR